MCSVCVSYNPNKTQKYCDVRAAIKIVVIVISVRSAFHVRKCVSDRAETRIKLKSYRFLRGLCLYMQTYII